ncbi:MAG TPA: class I SAM-dependent methyltransferase [Thermoanaerobaculia bacterium]|nr:class I SAM-dependent methyltransferase [Thermoanaerobaculia bacterium]
MSTPACGSCGGAWSDDPEGSATPRLVWVKDDYRIVECPHCGVLATSLPAAFDPAAVYSRDYFQGGDAVGYADYLGSEAALAAEYAARLAVVRSHVAGGRLLELGCATGGFLAAARACFEVQGLDVSAFAVEEARKKGLDAAVGSLEAAELAPFFDAIVAFDTIEHVTEPRRVAARAFELLRPGGCLVLSTGDAGSLLARLSGRRWRLLTPPHHLWFYHRRSMKRLLRGAGFELAGISYPSRLVPLSLAWYQLFRGRLGRLPAWLGDRVLRVNLFDTMTVVARRPTT